MKFSGDSSFLSDCFELRLGIDPVLDI